MKFMFMFIIALAVSLLVSTNINEVGEHEECYKYVSGLLWANKARIDCGSPKVERTITVKDYDIDLDIHKLTNWMIGGLALMGFIYFALEILGVYND